MYVVRYGKSGTRKKVVIRVEGMPPPHVQCLKAALRVEGIVVAKREALAMVSGQNEFRRALSRELIAR